MKEDYNSWIVKKSIRYPRVHEVQWEKTDDSESRKDERKDQ